jgi:hypothetical protein
VILNEAKDAVVEVFETDSPDSKPHWPEFYLHRPGCVFCGRTERTAAYPGKPATEALKWYFNYFYWEDTSRWGYGDPSGIAWSAAMALPEPIKMLAFVGGVGHGLDSSRS